MQKRFLPIVLCVFSLIVLVHPMLVSAAGQLLLKIGNSTITNQAITSWSYTSVNPQFSGIVEPLAGVNIQIDAVADTASADATGAWSYQPLTLDAGEHNVTISSGAESMAFTLTIVSSGSATTTTTTTTSTSQTSTTSAMPVTGSTETTLFLVAIGMLTLGSGAYALRRA